MDVVKGTPRPKIQRLPNYSVLPAKSHAFFYRCDSYIYIYIYIDIDI